MKQTSKCFISREIRQVCCMIFLNTVVKSVKAKVGGRNKMWWDYENRKNVVPSGLKDDLEKMQ